MKKLSVVLASAILVSSVSGFLTGCKQDPPAYTGPTDAESSAAAVDPNIKKAYDELETVTFGNYQGEDIEWIVLEKSDMGTLLFSKYAIDYMSFECTDVMESWQTVKLRPWLNEEFFEAAFSAEEQSKILWNETPVYDTSQYYDGEIDELYREPELDRVFLLNRDELIQYYQKTLPNCYCEPTKYAASKGASGTDCQWWLRGPCEIKTDQNGTNTGIPAIHGTTDPTAHNYILYQSHRTCGVRPAIWVDFDGTVENTIQPSDWIAEVSCETSKTADSLYVYTIYSGTEYEQTFTMDVNIDDYIRNGQFDLPGFLTERGWTMYDSEGMPTTDVNSHIGSASITNNGIETQFSFISTFIPTKQICDFSIEYRKPHASGTSIYDSEHYYDDNDRRGNFEIYDPMVAFDDHEIDYVVTGFGIDGFNEPTYGLSYSDIVILVYALDFVSDSNNSGKNPFYYTTMEGKESLWCSVVYDMP